MTTDDPRLAGEIRREHEKLKAELAPKNAAELRARIVCLFHPERADRFPEQKPYVDAWMRATKEAIKNSSKKKDN